jgi:hypothetical protein
VVQRASASLLQCLLVTPVLATNGSTTVPSSTLFAHIKDLVTILDDSTIVPSLTVDDSGMASGHDTPSGIGDSKPIHVKATCKEKKKGWDREVQFLIINLVVQNYIITNFTYYNFIITLIITTKQSLR